MSLLLGAYTIGIILSLLSLGMMISFRIIRFTDITVDGSFTLGAAITALLISRGFNPAAAMLISMIAGMGAGAITGWLHTKCRIQMILAGILMMTALYSVNLRIMGRSNIPLLNTGTYYDAGQRLLINWLPGSGSLTLAGWNLSAQDISGFLSSLLICILAGYLLNAFLASHKGMAMRATGENPQMVRAQGVNHEGMIILGLALSNSLVALSGSMMAQYQGFADIQMGIGMMVWGLASIIIGEALTGRSSVGISITGAILGTLLFRLLIAIALRWGLNPNDLKLITAVFVFLALIIPWYMKEKLSKTKRQQDYA